MPCPFCDAPLLGNPDICPECGKSIRAARPEQNQIQLQRQAQARAQAQRQAQAQAQAQAQVEAVPGLIDSRLFGAYVPENLPTEAMPGLETTAVDLPEEADTFAQTMPGLEPSSYGATAQNQPPPDEQVPGLIDSRLFGAYVPDGVDAAPIEGFESDRFDGGGKVAAKKTSQKHQHDDEGWVGYCPACGINLRSIRCPECGNQALPFDEGHRA